MPTSPITPPISALILSAGRGERMRPLTDTTPKPLLAVRGKPLLQWHVDALTRAGFNHLLINTAWLGEKITSYFEQQVEQQAALTFGLQSCPQARSEITFSHEGLDFGDALETLGGIARALPQLGDLFWLLAGDVFAPEFVFSAAAVQRFAASDKLAHLWLVPNPDHNPKGDFGLDAAGLALNQPKDAGHTLYTYSTIGLYRRALFEAPWCDIPTGNPQGQKAPLAPLLRLAMDQQRISAELYLGAWTDVGTPQRLTQLNTTDPAP
ncbi:MAG: nucleotidyltransferase family protein [Burkholderiaceae bacterium]